MWMSFIKSALKGIPEHRVVQPANIVSIRIDPLTGNRASAVDSNAIFEDFMLPYVPGNETPADSDLGAGGTGDIGDTLDAPGDHPAGDNADPNAVNNTPPETNTTDNPNAEIPVDPPNADSP